MKNYLAPILVVLLALSGLVFAMREEPVPPTPPSVVVATSSPVASATSSAIVTRALAPAPVVAGATASIKINNQSYPIALTEALTGLEAMQSLAAAGTLQFTGRDYPGLGFFVDSIDGIANEGGMYWVFYVNAKSATTGIASVGLSPGDTIEWKYEKGY